VKLNVTFVSRLLPYITQLKIPLKDGSEFESVVRVQIKTGVLISGVPMKDIYSRLTEIEVAARVLSQSVDEKKEVSSEDIADICDMIQDLSQISVMIASRWR